MKIKSLLLGSVAAAGLSTGAFAADLGVLTSLDVCDALGLSGLTISSDTNCLQITGEVKYEFSWGDWADTGIVAAATVVDTEDGEYTIPIDNGTLDWNSRMDAWIKFVATAESDFGPAKAVIKIKDVQQQRWRNDISSNGSDTGNAVFDEAYVSIGDSTVIMAGKKGTIQNFGDDVPLNFLGLFNASEVDVGVKWFDTDFLGDGGHVIQITSDLGNGVSVSAGLEKLDDDSAVAGEQAGVAVGVISYAGDGISAHVTAVAGGILDGVVEDWGVHAGFTGTFDVFKIVAAVAGDDDGYWNALASASATFDMFTIAISGETATDTIVGSGGTPSGNGNDWGVGASISAGVTEDVTLHLGGRWYHDVTAALAGGKGDGWQAAASVVAAVTETITLTGEVGIYGNNDGISDDTDTFYGAAQIGWAPGGGFTSSLKGEAYANGAYKATFKAAKTFE
jgi:hypothetical protein